MNKLTLRKRVSVWIALAATGLALTGCATISENTHAYLGSSHYAPVQPQSVQVYASEPAQPKERLGEIILSIDGNPPREKIEHKLQKAAARLGADGVFIASDKTHIHPYIYWDYYWGPVSQEDWTRLVVGVAFKNK